MLRVHDLRFFWRQAKETRVKQVNILDNRSSLDIIGVVQQRGIDSGVEQLFIRKPGNRFYTGAKILPELVYIMGAGEAPGEPNDRDICALSIVEHVCINHGDLSLLHQLICYASVFSVSLYATSLACYRYPVLVARPARDT